MGFMNDPLGHFSGVVRRKETEGALARGARRLLVDRIVISFPIHKSAGATNDSAGEGIVRTTTACLRLSEKLGRRRK